MKRRFAECLVKLSLYAATNSFEGEPLEIKPVMSPGLLPISRNNAAALAVEWGAEWMLWLDADQTFPRNTLHRLLAHKKPIVGANIRHRGDGQGTAKRRTSSGLEQVTTSAEVAQRTPLEQVELLGFGVTLTTTEAVLAVAKFNKGEPFYFERGIDREWMGEDYPFTHKAGRLGFPTFVDHVLSLEVGHIAETVLEWPKPTPAD